MNKLLNKAVELLEAIQLDLINNDISINAVLVEMIGEYLDDYYAEVSFLNENIHNIIKLKSETIQSYANKYFVLFNEKDDKIYINIESEDTDRTGTYGYYQAIYKDHTDVTGELTIIQPFKEI